MRRKRRWRKGLKADLLGLFQHQSATSFSSLTDADTHTHTRALIPSGVLRFYLHVCVGGVFLRVWTQEFRRMSLSIFVAAPAWMGGVGRGNSVGCFTASVSSWLLIRCVMAQMGLLRHNTGSSASGQVFHYLFCSKCCWDPPPASVWLFAPAAELACGCCKPA